MHNGSTIYFQTGWTVDYIIDWNGDAVGPNTWGQDVVMFSYNPNNVVCNGILPNRFGVINGGPSGYVSQNQTLYSWIFQ